jgi:hypothetical protein
MTRDGAKALPSRKEVRSHKSRGDTKALSSREAGSEATGHMTTPKPFLTER